MKLELKHLAPYLPYQLKVKWGKSNEVSQLTPSNFPNNWYVSGSIKPILYPLSDLTKEIEHNGDKFIPMQQLSEMTFDYLDSQDASNDYYYIYSSANGDHWMKLTHDDIWAQPSFVIMQLFEWHFDVFGLIPSGLAIDINTINSNQ
jgi:hypothetical protein